MNALAASSLAGKVAMATGASWGNGRAMASALGGQLEPAGVEEVESAVAEIVNRPRWQVLNLASKTALHQ